MSFSDLVLRRPKAERTHEVLETEFALILLRSISTLSIQTKVMTANFLSLALASIAA